MEKAAETIFELVKVWEERAEALAAAQLWLSQPDSPAGRDAKKPEKPPGF